MDKMSKKQLKEQFERELMIARQLGLFDNNPTDEERKAAEVMLKAIAKQYKHRK